MALYIDASALLKVYLDEPESDEVRRLLLSDPQWVSAAHLLVEVRRNLRRALAGLDLEVARAEFQRHWNRMQVVELELDLVERAAELGEATGARTLDALHLAAAERVGGSSVRFLTYDGRQAEAARQLGWTVLGG